MFTAAPSKNDKLTRLDGCAVSTPGSPVPPPMHLALHPVVTIVCLCLCRLPCTIVAFTSEPLSCVCSGGVCVQGTSQTVDQVGLGAEINFKRYREWMCLVRLLIPKSVQN